MHVAGACCCGAVHKSFKTREAAYAFVRSRRCTPRPPWAPQPGSTAHDAVRTNSAGRPIGADGRYIAFKDAHRQGWRPPHEAGARSSSDAGASRARSTAQEAGHDPPGGKPGAACMQICVKNRGGEVNRP